MMVRCRRPTCRSKFVPSFADIDGKRAHTIFCPTCRATILAKERASGRALHNKEALLSAAYFSSVDPRENYDYRIIDEFGQEVWAWDLANRYRKETQPRKASYDSAVGARSSTQKASSTGRLAETG